MSTVAQSSWINNLLSTLHLSLYASKPAYQHFLHLLNGIASERRNGSIKALRDHSCWDRHVSSVTRFFHHGQWDEEGIKRKLQQYTLQQLRSPSRNDPLFVLVDDSVCPKTKPSSQAIGPMEGASYHFDHKQGRSVYGHQYVVTMVGANDRFFPFAIDPYVKEKDSKLEIASQHLHQLPDTSRDIYVLADTWYASTGFIQTVQQRGWHFIGGLKSNRVLMAGRVPPRVRDWAKEKQQDAHLVTVGSSSYHVIRYDGKLKGGLKGTVLACWPEGEQGNEQAVRFFFCTDTSLSTADMLYYYSKRWNIETFFQETKEKLHLGDCRLRSLFAIKRYLLFLQLAYVLMKLHYQKGFSDAFKQGSKERQKQIVSYIYYQAQSGVPLSVLEKELLIA